MTRGQWDGGPGAFYAETKVRATLEDDSHRMGTCRSNGLYEFRCAVIDGTIVRKMVVLDAILRDTCHTICGIAGV